MRHATYIHQAKARHYLLLLAALAGAPAGGKGAGGRPRVHEELVHVLEALELVCAAPAEHVDVELVGLGQQQVGLAGDEGEALEEADAQAAVSDDLRQGQGGGLDVEAALDDLEVRRDGAEVLVGRLVGEVAEAQGLGDLARGEELFELRGILSACYAAHSGRKGTETVSCEGCASACARAAVEVPLGGCRELDRGCEGPLSLG